MQGQLLPLLYLYILAVTWPTYDLKMSEPVSVLN